MPDHPSESVAPLIGRRVVDIETGMVGTIVGVGEDYALFGGARDDMVSVDWDGSIVEPESLRAYDPEIDGGVEAAVDALMPTSTVVMDFTEGAEGGKA